MDNIMSYLANAKEKQRRVDDYIEGYETTKDLASMSTKDLGRLLNRLDNDVTAANNTYQDHRMEVVAERMGFLMVLIFLGWVGYAIYEAVMAFEVDFGTGAQFINPLRWDWFGIIKDIGLGIILLLVLWLPVEVSSMSPHPKLWFPDEINKKPTKGKTTALLEWHSAFKEYTKRRYGDNFEESIYNRHYNLLRRYQDAPFNPLNLRRGRE